MASYAGTGTERGRGGGGAGQAGYSDADRSGATGGGMVAAQEAAQQAAQQAMQQQMAQEMEYRNRLAAQQASQQAAQQMASTFGAGDPRRTALAASQGYTAGLGIMGERFGVSQPVSDVIFDEAGRVRGVVHGQGMPLSVTGLLAKAAGIPVNVYTGDPMYNPQDVSNRFDTGDRGGFYNQQRVPPVQDPVTGEARCPTGYVFNETLQACIMDTSATSPLSPESPNYIPPYTPPPTSSYFENQGLLGTPPSGILGTASDPYSYLRPYTQQRGYTLLS
jgi:hypothetical protein